MIVAERVLTISIQPIDRERDFETRFANWRRWCDQRGRKQERAGSAEGAWRSPQCWEPPNPRPPEIDLLDALDVNKAYIRLWMLAPSWANVIKVIVFKPYLRPQRQAQLLGTHYLKLDQMLAKAKTMLRNQLGRVNV